MPGGSTDTTLLNANAKHRTLKALPCRTLSNCEKVWEIVDPTLAEKEPSEKRLRIKVGRAPLRPTERTLPNIPLLHVKSKAFSRSKSTVKMQSLQKACRISRSRRKSGGSEPPKTKLEKGKDKSDAPGTRGGEDRPSAPASQGDGTEALGQL